MIIIIIRDDSFMWRVFSITKYIASASVGKSDTNSARFREYDGEDPHLITDFATRARPTPVSTVVHSSTDDLVDPAEMLGKFHDYDSHINQLERTVDELKFEALLASS